MKKVRGLLSVGLATGLLALTLAPQCAADQIKLDPPKLSIKPADAKAEADAQRAVKQIQDLQDYGIPPKVYFVDPEKHEVPVMTPQGLGIHEIPAESQAVLGFYKFPLKPKTDTLEPPPLMDLSFLFSMMLGGAKKDDSNPTKVGVALLELFDRTPADQVARITKKKFYVLLCALREYAARADDPKYQAHPDVLAGYKTRLDEIMARDIAGDTDYAGLGKQAKSLRAVIKEKQDALRAAMEKMKQCKGKDCPSIPDFVAEADAEMTTLQIGSDGTPLVPSTLVQLVKAIPEGELSESQWRTIFQSYPMGESLWRNRVDKLWRQKIDGSGVTVAILDVGIDKNHPYLRGHVQDGLDGVITTEDRYIDPKAPTFGTPNYTGEHGTHVASTVLAYAPNVKIVNIKILDEEKQALSRIPVELQRDEMGQTDAILKGMENVYQHNQDVASGKVKGERIDIVSMSLGIPETNTEILDPRNLDVLSAEVKKLSEQGVVVVVAAGNEGQGTLRKPGFAQEALAVGAADYSNVMAVFSGAQNVKRRDTGKTYDKPDIWAYGVDIRGAKLDEKGYEGKKSEELEETMSGTSMATPHVTGVTALLIQEGRNLGVQLTPAQVKKILSASSTPLANGNPYMHSDGGMIDPNAAVEYLRAHVKDIKSSAEWR